MKREAIVRYLRHEDLPQVISMSRRFCNESELPLTFSAENTRHTLTNAIESQNIIALVEEEDGVITGGIMCVIEKDFCEEYCAYIVKLYVEKEFRGLGTARSLILNLENEITKRGNVAMIFSSATAGMGGRVETLFVRLFEKFGYTVLGRVLSKEI